MKKKHQLSTPKEQKPYQSHKTITKHKKIPQNSSKIYENTGKHTITH